MSFRFLVKRIGTCVFCWLLYFPNTVSSFNRMDCHHPTGGLVIMALICLKTINAASVFTERVPLVQPGRELATEWKEHVEIYISSQSSILVIAFLLLNFFQTHTQVTPLESV